ncbi:sulfurtransferase [Parasulfuritortus cantonensis]|uniref:Sulfurtransferase n=1 Tax=Parasulfuritortus cantonensis TaxID=2528202 RepID=A0A4R1B8G8_9PROT|nr:rhodanese-like domain-containing protein [Parasulfuritortus cantonensis]TCJ12935.1 sulfurtransferase [Parasulfuritortus cantonensis]
MRHLRPAELKAWLDDPARERPFLLDVRESWEFDVCRIEGAELVPMRTIPARLAELNPGRETVVICHHGVRSFHAARYLEHNGFTNVINLTGGVDAWAKEADPTMPTY